MAEMTDSLFHSLESFLHKFCTLVRISDYNESQVIEEIVLSPGAYRALAIECQKIPEYLCIFERHGEHEFTEIKIPNGLGGYSRIRPHSPEMDKKDKV